MILINIGSYFYTGKFFFHFCVHDLKKFRYIKYVDCRCCIINRQIKKTFKICGIYVFVRLFSQVTNNSVNTFKTPNKIVYSSLLTYEKCFGFWRSFLLLAHANKLSQKWWKKMELRIYHIQVIFKITIILFWNYFLLIYQKLRNIRMTWNNL